jgi:polyhydroxyalkanoate synthesis repressor PhaR
MHMEESIVVIKKYTNRRLYNSKEGCYVKLDEIAGIIREGSDIRVIDSQTNEDITKQILAQIILEEEKNKKDLLPTALLYKIIRANEEVMKDFFENYLNSTIENYLTYRKAMEQKLSKITDISKLPFELGEIFMKSMGVGGGGSTEEKK